MEERKPKDKWVTKMAKGSESEGGGERETVEKA